MKIALLASGPAVQALDIYRFFKEGNRIDLDCLVTDNPEAAPALELKEGGVDILTFPETEWREHGDKIAGFLRQRGVKVVAIDNFIHPVTPLFGETFPPEAIVTLNPSRPAPMQIIEAMKAVTMASHVPIPKTSSYEEGEKSPEAEWAESLKVKFTPPQAKETSQPDSSTQPEQPVGSQVPPPYGTSYVSPFNPQQPAPAAATRSPLNSSADPQHQPMPQTYLIWAVLATVLCCLIPGIVAIIYAASVSSRYYAGDHEGAERASNRAQIWIIISIVTGIIWTTLYLPLMLLTGF